MIALLQITGVPVPSPLTNFKFILNPSLNTAFQNPSLITDVVSRLLTFAAVIAGLYFFVRLISSGFTYLTSLGEPAKIQAATKELTHALIGLIIVLTAFFLAQILQTALGIKIL